MEASPRLGRPLSTEISLRLGFHFDTTLWSNFEYYRNMTLYHDADCVGIIDGDEGRGKSVFAQQVGKAFDVDHELGMEQIVFKAKKFNEQIKHLKKGKAVVYDESQEGLDRRDWQRSKDIMHMLRVCRQRNLFLILVAQSYYDLDFRIAVRRSSFLIHVYWVADQEKKVFTRGYWKFFSGEAKKKLYCSQETKKFYEYPTRYADFTGKFSNQYVVNEQEYRAKKEEADFGEAAEEREKERVLSPKQVQEQERLAIVKLMRASKRNQWKLPRGYLEFVARHLHTTYRSFARWMTEQQYQDNPSLPFDAKIDASTLVDDNEQEKENNEVRE